MAGVLLLRKFQTTVYKDKSASDTAQIPAASATVKIYKHGATISSGTTVAVTDTAVAVYDVGRILAGDNVQLGTTAASQMTVVSVDSNTQLTLRSTIGSGIAVSAGNRLVVYSAEASIYANPTRIGTATTQPVTLGSSGLLEFYTPETRFDYIVTNGSTLTLFIDNEGGWSRGGTPWVNVKDYSTFQAAINALPTTGGTVFVPVGRYTTTTTPAVGAMTITKLVHLIGEASGRDGDTGGSIIDFTSGSVSTDLLTISTTAANYSVVKDLMFIGPNAAGSGRGIVFESLSALLVENCIFLNFPSYAAASKSGDCVSVKFLRSRFAGSKSGAQMSLGEGTSSCFAIKLIDTSFDTAENGATQCIRLGVAHGTTIENCVIEGDDNPASANGDTGAFIYASAGAGGLSKLQVTGCWFENNHADATPNSWFIYMVAPATNTTIENNFFRRTASTNTSLRAIKTVISGALGCEGVRIANNYGTLAGATGVGTDDVVLSANDSTILENNSYSDATLYHRLWRISMGSAVNVARVADNKRFKLFGITTAVRDALTDVQNGDLVYVTDVGTGAIQARLNGAWATIS
jgi:hypothetical protein